MKTQIQPKIYRSPIDPLNVPLYLSQVEDEMIAFNLVRDFCRLHAYNNWRENTHGLYLLRGNSEGRENILMGLLEMPEFPGPLSEVLSCLQFYNQHGQVVFNSVKKEEDYQGFILKQLARIVPLSSKAQVIAT